MESSPAPSDRFDLLETLTPVEYNPDRDSFRAEYDPSRDSTSLAVVAVVAGSLDTDPLDVPPLAAAVDTDALDDLFADSLGEGPSRGAAGFRYHGFDVTVFGDGLIEVTGSDHEVARP